MSEREEWIELICHEYDQFNVPEMCGRIADAIIADKTLLIRKHEDEIAALRAPSPQGESVETETQMELRTLREHVKLQAEMIETRAAEREEVARALFGGGYKCCASLGPYVRGIVSELNSARANDRDPAPLVEAVEKVLRANSEFRAGMPDDWDGDPLQHACDETKAALAAWRSTPNPETSHPVASPHGGTPDGGCTPQAASAVAFSSAERTVMAALFKSANRVAIRRAYDDDRIRFEDVIDGAQLAKLVAMIDTPPSAPQPPRTSDGGRGSSGGDAAPAVATTVMSDLCQRLLDLQDHYSTSGQLGPENRRIFGEAADEIASLCAAKTAALKLADELAKEMVDLREEIASADRACQRLCAKHGYATGHGDSIANMIHEISAQIPVTDERGK